MSLNRSYVTLPPVSYRDLKSYQNAEIIYDFMVEFCGRYVDPRSRTADQMVQAARSGKQNIVEASANPTGPNATNGKRKNS